MKVLGLDYGGRRIGVAVSDPQGSMAFPRRVIVRTSREKDVAVILRLAQEEEVERIVVGLPISLDGAPHAQAQRVEAFCEELRRHSPVPVETWDERFSTFEAEHALREAGVQPSQEKGRVDAAAAAIILQGWLDRAASTGSS